MAFVEKNAQQKFKETNLRTGVFELKIVNEARSKSIAFDRVADHQVEALLAVSTGKGLYHKISDTPFIKGNPQRFTKPKPFDCFYLKDQEAFVVICWYNPEKRRQNKDFHYIKIEDFLKKRDESSKKSMTKQESEEIASGVLTV